MASLLRENERILRPGGVIIITTPNYFDFSAHTTEWLLGKVSTVAYEEQHIAKFTIPRMEMLMNHMGHSRYKIETFFFIAPFLAFLGERFVKFMMRIEKRFLPRLGQLIFVKIQI